MSRPITTWGSLFSSCAVQAAIVSPVDGIGYQDELIKVPVGEDGGKSFLSRRSRQKGDTGADLLLFTLQSARLRASCFARLLAVKRARSRPSGPSRSMSRIRLAFYTVAALSLSLSLFRS